MNNQGKGIIEQKVEDFLKNEKTYLSKTFQETEARNRFIDPFFQALGWQLDQTHLNRNLWDVHREYSQRDNSTTKKPDYAFRVNSKLKFFVEAKAPWVRIIDNPDKDTMFQAKRYAYSTNGKAPIVIITDFHEFRVFNSLLKPVYDNPTQGLLKEFDFKYHDPENKKDYLNNWDFIYEHFSKEAVMDGSIERLRGKISKNTKTLDSDFLSEIIIWRENLAKNVAIRNEALTVDEINEAVQRILDRLVFIRNLEDREIIGENTLFNITGKNENLYSSLLPIFSELNLNYNGLLFKPHFSEKLNLNDKVLKDTIQSMTYPRSPFQFDVIEPEILGRIYEQFLGSKIRLTDSHRAKVEEKVEVRHAGGVYYTPQFIVDYIVKETVGKKIEGLKPEDISKIKILDPACGSGSFLLGAYHYLMEYHRKFYESNKSVKKYKDDFYENVDGDIKLTIKIKGEILVNNIYGVDIDREATEVAILSLYLKLLEHGIEDDQGWLFLKGKVLPDMTGNIKCGNSLIDREDLFSNNMFGTSEIKKFDWKSETDGFGKVFKERNGFDCIIGNPPYIRIQEMQKWAKDEVDLYKKIYKSGSKGNFDIYVLFIEKALDLLNSEGLTGFILPHKFFNATYGEQLREVLSSGKNVAEVVHFGDLQIFDGPTTYTCLLFLSKFPTNEFMVSKVKSIEEWREYQKAETGKIAATSLTSGEWNFQIGANSELIKMLEQIPNKLGDVCHLFVGLQTDGDDIFILEEIEQNGDKVKCYSKALDQEHWFENEHLKYLVKGSLNIKPYMLTAISKRLIFPYITVNDKSILIDVKSYKEKFPLSWNYLEINKKRLSNRNKGEMGNAWYGYVYKKNHTRFDQKKILVPSIAARSSFAYDIFGKYYFVGSGGGGGGGYGITLNEESPLSYEYLLGLLNSKLLDTYLQSYSSPFRGGYFAYNRQYIEKLPIYIPDKNDPTKFQLCQSIESLVKQILELRKVGKIGDAEFLEKKIDEMVEELYGVKG
jgi:type I restriction-modification system DNA methylase subunit